MDDQTKRLVQTLLDLVKSNTAQLSRLQAISSLQNQVLISLLVQADSFAENPPELIEAYEKVRETALQTIELADQRDDFDALLSLIDRKFLGIYR